MKRPALVALALGACLAVCGAATAGGGSDIAGAPQVPIGQTVVGGGTCSGATCDSHGEYSEYWRIFAQASDMVAIDYTGVAPTTDIIVCLFKPGVTDATRANATCLYQDEGVGTRDWVVTVPTAGNWTIGIVGGGFASTLAYQLTVHIHHYTDVAITAPGSVTHNGSVMYSGAVTGASGGKVQLSSRTPGAGWKPVASVTVGANGSFKYKARVGTAGTYHLKAVYRGDSSHLPSAATIAFKVT